MKLENNRDDKYTSIFNFSNASDIKLKSPNKIQIEDSINSPIEFRQNAVGTPWNDESPVLKFNLASTLNIDNSNKIVNQ